MANSIYLIDRTGRVAFRALWAGQEALIREHIEQLLSRESNGEDPVVLGETENRLVRSFTALPSSSIRWDGPATGLSRTFAAKPGMFCTDLKSS